MAKRKSSAVSRKPARGSSSRQPAGAAKRLPGSAATAAVLEAPLAASPVRRSGWWGVAIVALIALIGLELLVTVKNNIKHQWKVTTIRYYGERGETPDKIGKFWGATCVLLDETRQRICLVDGMFNKILFWDLQKGNLLIDMDKDGPHQISPDGKIVARNFTPAAADMDGEGNVVVLDKNHAEVTTYSPKFTLVKTWSAPPSGMLAVNQAGEMYILNYATMEIVEYTPDGKEVKRFGKDVISNPGKIVTDEAGNIYVLDLGRKAVISFSPEGKHLRTFSPRVRPFGDQDMVVRGGLVYLSIYAPARLLVYTTQGDLAGEAVLPVAGNIAVDAHGLLYLAGPGGLASLRVDKKP